jgi:hypothetical protein
MQNIHKISNLPNQKTINSIALLGEKFTSQQLEFPHLLVQLEALIKESKFMRDHDNSLWMTKRGRDFFNNPKLFAQAPLTYVCAFLSELFKSREKEETLAEIPETVLQQALIRLQDFKLL